MSNINRYDSSALLYDWNKSKKEYSAFSSKISFLDETLRDGLQSPSIIHPSVDEKLQIIKNMCNLGIDHLDIGFPGASKKILDEIVVLVNKVNSLKLPIQISCAARTHSTDIEAVIDLSQRTGTKIELLTFIGSSELRKRVEKWDLQKLVTLTEDAIEKGVKAGLPVSFVTEDTTRSHPRTLDALFKTAILTGATRLVLCDTVGQATPNGVLALVEWTNNLIKNLNADIQLDWHGHNDRGFATINSIYAMYAGCNRLHATGLGIGERAGNTSMEQLLVNLKMLNLIDNSLLSLTKYSHDISKYTKTKILNNCPIIGEDVFSTATGVHASAIIKAAKIDQSDLSEQIYSSIPANLIGRTHKIQIGCMSGKANVTDWLIKRQIKPNKKIVEKILSTAKSSTTILEDEDIYNLISV